MANTKTMKQWLKESLKPHKPSMAQRMIKERLLKTLEEMEATIDVESLTMDQLVNIAGTTKIKEWAEKSPSFLPWLLDQDYQSHKIKAAFDLGVEQIIGILESEYEPKILTAKDKIAAFNILANVADKMPTKRKEVRYLDESVGNLPASELDKELAAAKQKLLSAENKS